MAHHESMLHARLLYGLAVAKAVCLQLITRCQSQVHIVQRGAVRPLIRMLEATDTQLREMAAFALGRLAQVLIIHLRFWLRDHCCSLVCNTFSVI